MHKDLYAICIDLQARIENAGRVQLDRPAGPLLFAPAHCDFKIRRAAALYKAAHALKVQRGRMKLARNFGSLVVKKRSRPKGLMRRIKPLGLAKRKRAGDVIRLA